MKKLLQQCALVLVLVALYFASDLYAKGRMLNQLLPIPILGYLFCGLLLFAAYDIVLKPIIEFWRMARVKRDGNIDVTKVARTIMRQLDKSGGAAELKGNLKEELRNGLQTQDTQRLHELIDRYYSDLDGNTAAIIRNYSWKTALCVVFSRNTVVDAVMMFISQYKMALELMKTYGFTPSPVFNVLCFFWIASNSMLNGVFSQANADTFGSIIRENLVDIGVEGIMSKGLSKLGAFALEAMTAATTVYVTGWIVNRKLKGDRCAISVKELFELRSKARKALVCNLPVEIKDALGKHEAEI
ncbi:MAG: hypothetical protein K6G18_03245 [Treponema sp.]|nr:hypothetical protein [Treponema sp.]